MTDQENFVTIENLTKIYNGKSVLSIQNLSLTKGKIYAIIGPSGAGKSTLLRLINLLDIPTSGLIQFNERFFSQNPQQEMTMVFQKPFLFRTSVRKNIEYGLNIRKYDQEKKNDIIANLLKTIGLQEYGSRFAHSLSGGEAQRVSLARAVAFKPKLLLLDEPTANLDPGNVEILEKIIQELHQEIDMTVLMVTHNIFQAKRLADEIIFLNQGNIVETGTKEKIFSEAENPLTKAFIEGKMIF